MPLILSLLLSTVVSLPATLTFTAPDGWVAKAPSSSMRLAEFSLPRATADTEDGSVTVFFFGATQGGNVQANIDRWLGQMAQPDGRASKDVATSTRSTTTSGLPLTVVDVPGTYVAEVAPGSSEKFNKPGFRQIAVAMQDDVATGRNRALGAGAGPRGDALRPRRQRLLAGLAIRTVRHIQNRNRRPRRGVPQPPT